MCILIYCNMGLATLKVIARAGLGSLYCRVAIKNSLYIYIMRP